MKRKFNCVEFSTGEIVESAKESNIKRCVKWMRHYCPDVHVVRFFKVVRCVK